MQHIVIFPRLIVLLSIALLAIALPGCDGKDGEPGSPGEPGPAVNPSLSVSALDITIDSVSVKSPPVVKFSVRDQVGLPFVGLTSSDLRFNIAKLVPGTIDAPSTWQSYINRASSGAMRASQERDRDGYPLGDLVDHGDGSYTYTFETDLSDTAANCPAPCTDADGKPLDVSYNPRLTHRVVIQLSHSLIDGLPPLNEVYTFRPSDGATKGISLREIVRNESCNECHNQLRIHGSRVETQFCVTCHNPGTWDPNGNTADFKVMIHKIHRGAGLPSGIPYEIGGHDYSTVIYPQDIRNCSKCHDGADPGTPQGDNWKTNPSMQACGSCHDDKDFSKDGSAWAPNPDPNGHSGGIMTDNSNCLSCHKSGLFGSIEEAHAIPGREEAKNYQLVINGVTGGATPVIDLSVINPNNGIAYDLASGDATTNPVFKASNARLVAQVAWSTQASAANVDYNNVGSVPVSGQPYTPSTAPTPAQPISIDFVDDCSHHLYGDPAVDPEPDWVCDDIGADNIFTLTKQTPLPTGAAGTGRVAIEGHPALPDNSGRMVVRSVIKDFAITDAEPIARREVVDIDKCNQCHDQLSLHGSNRTDEPGLCVMCHNPSLTDISYNNDFNSGPCAALAYPNNRARPKKTSDDTVNGNIFYALESCLDGKTQESADFKRLIHGIHAGQRDDPDTPEVEGYGFRRQGIQVRRDDFSHVRFPGILQDCDTCHLPGTYVLQDSLEAPTLSGLQSSTVDATAAAGTGNADPVVYGDSLNDQADDLRISPTAAACSACHDSDVARAHMILPGGAVFDKTQADITNMVEGNFETCSVCHGPGRSFDVEAVHGLD